MSTTSFKAIIINDERHCIETLRYELMTHCPEVTIVATHQDTLSGIQSINTLEPDIVFLEIELDNATGFLVGAALNDNNGNERGAVYVYQRRLSTWNEVAKLKASDAEAEDRFGQNISMSEKNIIVGVSLEDFKGSNSGSAYIFNK